MKRKVLRADAAGFCEGVARAVNEVRRRAGQGERLATLGPLVHNPIVVAELEALGVRVISDASDYRPGETVVIRTHGVAPAVKQELETVGANILDLTCTRVARVQKLIARAASEGRPVVIAGDPDHAEAVGLKGFSGNLGVVVPGPDYKFKLPDGGPVLVVSQTTQNPESFRKVAETVQKKAKEAEIINTICAFTVRRQEGVRALLGKVGAAVVVGGRMSANTQRLVEVFEKANVPVQHVETEADIDFAAFGNAAVIGVAAGASTPPDVVDRVVKAIEEAS